MKVCLYCLLALICVVAAAAAPDAAAAGTATATQQGSETHPSARIVDGNYAATKQFPYQVALLTQTQTMGYWWCGGSIISHNWVLTAGRCVYDARNVTIYYGATKLSKPRFVITVNARNITRHPQYDPYYRYNDIALIQTPIVPFDAYVNKVALPPLTLGNAELAGYWAVFTGWGATKNNGPLSQSLEYATFDIISNSDCQLRYGAGRQGQQVLCARTPTKTGPCSGDVGGPLVLKTQPYQVGIFSTWTNPDCKASQVSEFTRVTNYLNWIRNVSGIYYS